MKKILVGIATAVFVGGALVGSALATSHEKTQTLDATLSSSITLSLDTASVAWTLKPVDTANATSAGKAAVTANAGYNLSVKSDGVALREFDGTAYVTGGKSLGTSPSLTPSVVTGSTAGATALTGGAVTNAGSTALASNLTGGGTDTYSLALKQPTTSADLALPTGRTYHAVFTYTAAATI